MTVILGLDLAKKNDFSALCVITQELRGTETHYMIHAIERLPHGMPYPAQVAHVQSRVNNPLLRGAALAADETGVGSPVIDMLRQSNLPVSIWPILITGGTAVTYEGERCCYHVPKSKLVSLLSVLLESRRLRNVPELQYRDILWRELQSFSSKITPAGNEVFGTWRENKHDDLVLSVALALWLGENTAAAWDGKPGIGEKGLVAQAPPGVWMGDNQPNNDPTRHPREVPVGLQFPRW